MVRVLSILLFVCLATPAVAKVELSLRLEREPVAPGSVVRLTAVAAIVPGWHINAHRPNEEFLIPTELTFELPPGVTTSSVEYPDPEEHSFAFAPGKVLLVYDGDVGMAAALAIPADSSESRLRIGAALRYQACNDTTCLPPRTVRADLSVAVGDSKAAAASGPAAAGLMGGVGIDFEGWFADRGLLLTLALVFLLGVGLNLTPCVYPLISVTIAYFGTQAKQNAAGVMRLAAAYVLGITLTFSAVGVAAAFSGGIFGAALQRPPVLIFIATVLTLLALSSFGLYQLQPPAWLLQRAGGAAQGTAGAIFMGSTMGLVAAPCVGPVVIGLLLFVGSQQSVSLGVGLFFALGLGLGLPYLGLAAAAGSLRSLPRSGDWLLWVERLFGFVLLGMALFFVLPLLPAPLRPWPLPALMAAAGFYLGFVDRAGDRLPRFRSFQRLAGVAVMAAAVWFAWPRAVESKMPWRPLDLAEVERVARAGRPAVIDFVADWCIPCHEMEATTWSDPRVLAEAGRFVMFKADITKEDQATGELVQHFRVLGVPTVIYLDEEGRELGRRVGYVGPDEMLAEMQRIGGGESSRVNPDA